jgi:P27 family predicted phage terminase small subunit
MGKRGPKGKSAELESAQGFPGRRKSKTESALKAAEPPEPTEPDDIQDELPDSRFVQPPPHLGKSERKVWAEIFSGPNARLWYKFSDHSVIARYCTFAVIWRQQAKVPPKPTYTIERIRPYKEGEVAPLPEIMIKRNPAFDAFLALARELRSIERDVGLSPDSRLNLEKKGLEPGDRAQPKPEPAQHGKPSGPVGILKARTQMN